VDNIERVTGMKPTKSCLCHRTATVVMEQQQNISDYLNIIRSSNNGGLVEYWNYCFTEFSKFTYVRFFKCALIY